MLFGSLTLIPLLACSLLLLVSFLFIAAMQQKDAKPADVGTGVFLVLMQTVGTVLMSIAGLPAVYSVLMRQGLSMGTYMSLLLMFAVGGVLYLLSEEKLRQAGASAKIPLGIIHVLWKITGLIAFLAGFLSLASQVLIAGPETALWSLPMHGTVLLFGFLLLWCTKEPRKKKGWFGWGKKKK